MSPEKQREAICGPGLYHGQTGVPSAKGRFHLAQLESTQGTGFLTLLRASKLHSTRRGRLENMNYLDSL